MTAPTSTLDLGDLRRVTPIDSGFGLGRGKPVDRHYIEDFLCRHAADMRGRVLEVGENVYTPALRRRARDAKRHPPRRRFEPARDAGRRSRRRERAAERRVRLLHLHPDAHLHLRRAARGADDPSHPRSGRRAARDGARHQPDEPVRSRPLGRVLALHGAVARALARRVLRRARVEVEAYGNVLASTAFLQGLWPSDLSRDELDHRDQRYQMLVAGRAVKAG